MNATRGPVYRLLLAASLCLTPLALSQEQPAESQPEPAKPEAQPDKPQPPTPASPAPTAPGAKPTTTQPAPAESGVDVPEGRQLFLAASDTIKRAKAITYRVKSYAEGQMLTTYMSRSQADVRMLRSGTGWLVRATGSGSSMSVKDGTEFDVAWMGLHNEWVDHTAKKVIEKNARDSKGGAYQLAPPTKMDEFVEANPYSAEIAAADYLVEAQREKDGVMCDVILVITGRQKMRWMLGAEDHLPRWKERIIEGNAAAGSMITEVSNISVDTNDPPRLTPDTLRVTVPEGYTEDRVPPPPPPPPPGEKPDKGVLAPAPSPAEKSKPEGPPPPPPPPTAPLVQHAQDFDLKDALGQTVTLASLRGNPVVLEFAGTWCLPLREAHPDLEQFAKDYKHLNVKVYMLDVREKSAANAVNDLKQFSFGLLLDADQVARLYNIKKYPTYVVIDRDGNIVKTEAGFKKPDTMNALRDAVNQITADRAASQPKPEDRLSVPPSAALGAPSTSPSPAPPK
jgi:thiol-disulfide isomerase/thioredoxin